MPAIDFPSTPSVDDTVISGNQTWVWDGITWNLVTSTIEGPTGPAGADGYVGADGATGPQGAKGAYTVSDTAPVAPGAGDVWLDSTTGKTFIYYADGTSSQWVEFGTASQLAMPLHASSHLAGGTDHVKSYFG